MNPARRAVHDQEWWSCTARLPERQQNGDEEIMNRKIIMCAATAAAAAVITGCGGSGPAPQTATQILRHDGYTSLVTPVPAADFGAAARYVLSADAAVNDSMIAEAVAVLIPGTVAAHGGHDVVVSELTAALPAGDVINVDGDVIRVDQPDQG